MKVILSLYDMHVPYNIPLSGIEAYAKDLSADFGKIGRVYGGDNMGFDEISHWNKRKLRQIEGRRLRHSYDIMNRILDRQDKICKGEIHYLYGNHEDWIEQLLDELPQLEGLFEPEKYLKLKERGYKVYPPNYYARVGKLMFIHGMFHNLHHAKKTVERIGRSVVYGHTHTHQAFTVNSPIDSQDIHRGVCVPCLFDFKKYARYLKSKPTNWSHGFGVTFFNDKGYFQHCNIDIVRGRFIGLNGKEYKN